MTLKLSRTSSKYVWLSLPHLAALALTFGWLTAGVPESQKRADARSRWQAEQLDAKSKQDFLATNRIYSDYSQLILEGLNADDADVETQIVRRVGQIERAYGDGQIVRLLDETQRCVGYVVSPGKIYTRATTPGICDLDIPAVEAQLKN